MKTVRCVAIICVVITWLVQLIPQGDIIAQGKETRQEKAHNRDTTYLIEVENLPEPVGGLRAIQQNVHYPELAKKAGIEGTVHIAAFIDENGNVARTEIAKGVHEALDRAASDAVLKTKFKPGTQKGKPVRVRISIPIRFRLDARGKSLKHSLYPGNYTVSAGAVEVPEDAGWKVFNPESRSDKVLLVLQEKWSKRSGFWSVISYLTPEEALQLSQELREAAEKAKKK